jgi:predicted small metal-binding protein
MELKCDDVVGGLGCDFVATGDTAGEVRDTMLGHGGAIHADLMAGMSSEEAEKAYGEMVQHIEQLIAANN